MVLINKEVNDVLNILVGDMFALNRLFDRAVSVLDVKYTMKNSAKHMHDIAHHFANIADKISGFQASRGQLTIYPQTPIGADNYNTVSEIFSVLCMAVCKVEENISNSVKFACDANDQVTKSFLQSFLLSFSKYTEQMMLISDKMEMYSDTPFAYTQLDSDFEKFMIV